MPAEVTVVPLQTTNQAVFQLQGLLVAAVGPVPLPTWSQPQPEVDDNSGALAWLRMRPLQWLVVPANRLPGAAQCPLHGPHGRQLRGFQVQVRPRGSASNWPHSRCGFSARCRFGFSSRGSRRECCVGRGHCAGFGSHGCGGGGPQAGQAGAMGARAREWGWAWHCWQLRTLLRRAQIALVFAGQMLQLPQCRDRDGAGNSAAVFRSRKRKSEDPKLENAFLRLRLKTAQRDVRQVTKQVTKRTSRRRQPIRGGYLHVTEPTP